MKKQKIKINLLLASMLAHFGDEKLSTTSLARRQEFNIDGKKVKIPVYSGNAFRGQCRRLIMDNFLELAGIEEISPKMYHTLFSGGALTSGLSFSMSDKQQLVSYIPALGLLGTAIGDTILQSKCCFDICYPVCSELNVYNEKQSDVSYRNYISDTFHTRRDGTKSEIIPLTNEEKGDNPVQMKYEFEGLVAGTELETSITISDATDIETACLGRILKLFKENEFIGGKSSIGYGKFSYSADTDIDDTAYVEFIKDNSEAIRKYVKDLSGKLK